MSNSKKVPVLMYHALVEKRTDQLHTVHISTELFTQEMEWLAANGYKTISIDEMAQGFTEKAKHGKFCVITFDDGYQSLYKHAMPVLKQYGFNATLYLATAAVGEDNFSSLASLNPKTLPVNDRPLTWSEIKDMSNNGWDIQSHSISHADNSQLNTKQLKHEIAESKKIIEHQLRQPVLHYAFPFGKYNTESLSVTKKAGYKTATTVHSGLCAPKSDLFRLPRLEMNSNDSLLLFEKKITTGFSSPKEKMRSSVRNVVFGNPKMKDISKKILGKRIN